MAQVSVQGVIERLHQNGRGFSLVESFATRNGREARRYWGVFLGYHTPLEAIVGDTVQVSGGLRATVSTRDSRYVDHTVNDARVTVTQQNGDRSWGPPSDDEPPAWDAAPPPPDPTWATAPVAE